MASTDIKDYYRRAWGLGDRVPFKYGGTWADWKVHYEDQMSFEEYLQDDKITKKLHALDKRADGGRIGNQKPRLGYVALPLVINPTTIGLVATTLGIAGEAARRYINENPGIVQAAEQGVDKIKEFVSFKKEKEEPSKEVVKKEQTDWSLSYKDKEPKPPIEEPPEGEPDLLPELTKSTAEEVIRKQIKEKEGTYFPEVVEDLEIQELIKNYRKSKTKEGSTQPTLKLYEKIDLVNSVVDTFKKKYNRLPAYTDLKTFFPKLSNLAEVIREGDIEIGKAKADYDRTDPEYIRVMETKAQKKAIDDNTLTYFAGKNFFPETITYNGETYDAEEFFMNNLIEKAKHGKWRKTGKTTLKNEELAKLYNTNERKIEEIIKNIRKSPEWNVTEPGPVDRSIYDIQVRELIEKANKNLSPVEKKNVNIQDNWIWEANQDLGSRSLKSVKKNKPQLIKELQWKLVDGEIVQVKRPDEKLTEDLKKFFSVNHNVKKSTKQFNIQTLVNRGLTTSKINFLLNSIEAYIKKNPTHIRKIQSMDKFLRKRGLRIRIDGVSEELLDKLGKKTNFFGSDPSPKGMFNSGTGQSVQWEKYLKFLDLALDGPEGVPLKKELSGVSKETIRKKYEGVVDERLLNNMLNDTDPGRLAEVMATIDEQLIMQGKGMGPDEIIEATTESWKRKKQATGGLTGVDQYIINRGL